MQTLLFVVACLLPPKQSIVVSPCYRDFCAQVRQITETFDEDLEPDRFADQMRFAWQRYMDCINCDDIFHHFWQ